MTPLTFALGTAPTRSAQTYGLDLPILLAPMAGASPVSLAIAVANAGGMGAMGALVSSPAEIREWAQQFRANSNGMFQLNTWIPDPPQPRNREQERRIRQFLVCMGTRRTRVGRRDRKARLR